MERQQAQLVLGLVRNGASLDARRPMADAQLKQDARKRRERLERRLPGGRERRLGGGRQPEAWTALSDPRLEQGEKGPVELVDLGKLV
jgi:hypothetical protein